MQDKLCVDACALAEQADPSAESAVTDTQQQTIHEQFYAVVPRLSAIGARVAVLAPILVGSIIPDSFGRGVACS